AAGRSAGHDRGRARRESARSDDGRGARSRCDVGSGRARRRLRRLAAARQRVRARIRAGARVASDGDSLEGGGRALGDGLVARRGLRPCRRRLGRARDARPGVGRAVWFARARGRGAAARRGRGGDAGGRRRGGARGAALSGRRVERRREGPGREGSRPSGGLHRQRQGRGGQAMSLRSGIPDARGHFGPYGGSFVPETLVTPLLELEAAYRAARADPAFARELTDTLASFAGRPTPLYLAERFAQGHGDFKLYLKREDLLHTGAHKINNTIGQCLLTRRMGKQRVIAETGAGQHGVATAPAAA